MKKTRISYNLIFILFFLVQPFLALIYALRKYKNSWSKNIVWLFVIFFGFTFVITKNSTSDSVRYAAQLHEIYNKSLSIKDIFLQSFIVDGFTDLYQPIVTFIVSRFSDNYNILFATFGLVFGYFYSRNIWYLLEKSENPINKYSILLIFVFASIVSIYEGINGVRFWTASQVFYFGFIRYIDNKKAKYLLISIISIIFHFSFFVPSLLIFIYILFKNKWKIYYVFFVISFFISELSFTFGQKIVQMLPTFLQQRADYYIGMGGEFRSAEIQNMEVSWFLILNERLIKLTIFILASYIVFNHKKLINSKNWNSYLSTGLLFYGTFNILSFYPSVGRFLSISVMILFSLFFLISNDSKNKLFKQLILFCSPALALFLTISIRNTFDYASYLTFLGNPILKLLLEPDKSLWQIINNVLL